MGAKKAEYNSLHIALSHALLTGRLVQVLWPIVNVVGSGGALMNMSYGSGRIIRFQHKFTTAILLVAVFLALALSHINLAHASRHRAEKKIQSTVKVDAGDKVLEKTETEKNEDVAVAEDGKKLPPEIPPPHFARNKPVLPEEFLEDKREGRYFIPVPQIGVDPDVGYVVGMGVTFFDNGSMDSPFFRIQPYRQMIALIAAISSGGMLAIGANYDHPNIFDSPWRVRGNFQIWQNPSSKYFGIGNDSQTLTFPGSNITYGSYDDYNNALKLETNGTSYSRYDEYKLTQIAIGGSAEYDLLGGLIRPLFGFRVARIWATDYTGDNVTSRNAAGQSVIATEQPTHLRDDCNSGRAIGCRGGYDVYVKLGITLDTRNFEPDPSSGILFQLTSELSPTFLGSLENYGRLATSLSAYGNVFERKEQQIIAVARVFYSWQFGDVPFYTMDTMAFNDRDQLGLGGFASIRGYKQNRFIGPVTMLTNAEIRWYFKKFTVWKQRIKLGIAPFIDAGRAFDNVSDTTFRGWHLGGGGGLRLTWNLSTVICFDYAVSAEGQLFYMNAGLPF